MCFLCLRKTGKVAMLILTLKLTRGEKRFLAFLVYPYRHKFDSILDIFIGDVDLTKMDVLVCVF